MKGNSNKQPGDGQPKSDISYNDLHKTITRTITVTKPGEAAKTTTQTIKYQRNATIDDVTGEVRYGEWTVTSGSSEKLPAVEVADVPGYTKQVSGEVGEKTPSQEEINNWTGPHVTVTYTANSAHIHVHFQTSDGSSVSEQIITGVTGQSTAGKQIEIPAGWVVDGTEPNLPDTFSPDGSDSNNVIVKIKHVTKKIDPTKNPDNLPDIPQGAKTKDGAVVRPVTADDFKKQIKRTIIAHVPNDHGSFDTIDLSQFINLYRTGEFDEVSKLVTFGNWSSGSFAALGSDQIPHKAGYVPNIREVPAVQNVDGSYQDPEIEIYYTPISSGSDNSGDDNGGSTTPSHPDHDASTQTVDMVLTHNAFLYTTDYLVIKKKGKVIDWRKGRHIKVWNNGKIVMINNIAFYQVGKNAYVKVSNTKIYKPRRFKLKHNAYVYNRHGKVVRRGKHHKKIVLKKKSIVKCIHNGNGRVIKGRIYYQIGKNRFIKAYNTIPQRKRDYIEM